LQKNIYIIKV